MRVRIVVAGALAGALGLGGCGLNVDDPYDDRPIVSLDAAPPPIAGGTLLVTRDGRHAVAADPDRDRVVIVDLASRAVRSVALEAGLDPGRAVETSDGRVLVALRRGGGLVELDPERAELVARHAVCASPRGLAVDASGDRVHVACADGTLATLDGARSVERTVQLAPDLRDVVVLPSGDLLVSRYRSAELLAVSRDGVVAPEASRLPIAELVGTESTPEGDLRQQYAPGVAVRLASAGTGAVVLHQRARIGVEAVFEGSSEPRTSYTYSNDPVSNDEGVTWRDPCGNSVVHAAATFVGEDGGALHGAPSIEHAVVPTDVAVSPGGRLALAFAGEPGGEYRYGAQVVEVSAASASRDDPGGCLEPERDRRYPGQVIAVAFAGEVLVAQLREPARLVVGEDVVELGGGSVRDSGHDVFHLDTGGAIACASCHPEGGDDGHVWHFAATTPRRTQPLEGMVGQAPYHRAGDVPSFEDLMNALSEQMASPPLGTEALRAAERWLTRLPAPPSGPVVDPAAVERGRVVFETAGCAGCHEGELGTDHRSHRVEDRELQTPPLRGIALRAPYLYDGRAPVLRAAFATPSDVTSHGATFVFEAGEIADLEAYLASR